MLFRLLGKTVWFVGKMAVKHVVVPIAITAATAVVLGKLAERLDAAAEAPTNGTVADSAPAPATRKPRARKPAPASADA